MAGLPVTLIDDSARRRRYFPSVDFIGDYRAGLNIAKQYRLVCDMRFDLSRALIRHIVTHQEYERVMKRGQL